jgi:integrase
VLTLSHLIDSFLVEMRMMVKAGLKKPATVQWYDDNLKPLAPLREFPADALRTQHLAAITLSTAFVRCLKRLYKWAADGDLIPRDPFAKLSIPPAGRRNRTLTRAELSRLYRAGPRPFRLLLMVQLRTRARPGELRGLTWAQVDWTQRVLWLWEFKGQNRRKDKLKARAIPMDVVVTRLLRNLHRKAKDPSPAGHVFISTRGGRAWTSNGLRCAMRTARAKCGLDGGDEPVVCYHMRHTGATEAVRCGVDLKHLAELMGHTRTTTTERYVHLDTSDLVKTMDKLNAGRRRDREAG